MYPAMPPYAMPPVKSQVVRVNGRNGAEAFRLAENSSMLMLDENEPIVWFKVTDGAGYATVTPYAVTPYQPAPEISVATLDERIRRLEELLNGKSDDTNAKPEQ